MIIEAAGCKAGVGQGALDVAVDGFAVLQVSKALLPFSQFMKQRVAEAAAAPQGRAQRALQVLLPPQRVQLVVTGERLISSARQRGWIRSVQCTCWERDPLSSHFPPELLKSLLGHGLLHLCGEVWDLQPLLLHHHLPVGCDVHQQPAHQVHHLWHVLHLTSFVAVQQMSLPGEVLRQSDGAGFGFCAGENAPQGNQELGKLPHAQQLASGLDRVGSLCSHKQDSLVCVHPGGKDQVTRQEHA